MAALTRLCPLFVRSLRESRRFPLFSPVTVVLNSPDTDQSLLLLSFALLYPSYYQV